MNTVGMKGNNEFTHPWAGGHDPRVLIYRDYNERGDKFEIIVFLLLGHPDYKVFNLDWYENKPAGPEMEYARTRLDYEIEVAEWLAKDDAEAFGWTTGEIEKDVVNNTVPFFYLEKR